MRFCTKIRIDVNALHCLTVNGIELYADSSTKSRVRVKVRPERISSAFALSENAMYTVHSRIEAVDVELPEEEKLKNIKFNWMARHSLLQPIYRKRFLSANHRRIGFA